MTVVLEVRNLTMRFGMVTAAEVENVSLCAGEFVGIIGPNGAGKTTFLNLVTGYLKPQTGSIHILGHDIAGLRPHQVTALGVGRSFQIPQLFTNLTTLENILIGLATAAGDSLRLWRPLKSPARLAEARHLLQQFGLADAADRPAGELSEGGRKLLDIAMAFALRPRLLLMDEPTSGVSIEDKFEIMDTLVQVLKQASVTAIFIEHDMEVVRRYAGRVLVLRSGKVVADGAPAAILAEPEIRREVGGWR